LKWIVFVCALLYLPDGKAKDFFSKAPFLTIRKFTDIDSTPVTTVTCSAKITVKEELKNSWLRVASGGREGFVLSKLLTQSNNSCIKKRSRLLINSISLSADEIYLWAKLGEHFIEGEVNGF
jgi:hypothetical protein